MLMKKKHCTPQQRPIFYLTEDPEDPADFEDPAQIPKIPFALAVSAGIVRDRQGSSGSVRERQGASGIVRVVRDRQGASGIFSRNWTTTVSYSEMRQTTN